MIDDNSKGQPPAPATGIPAELLDELHQANQQFHDAREHVEEAMEAEVNPLIERDRAAQDVKEAEQAVEKVEEKIGKELKKR